MSNAEKAARINEIIRLRQSTTDRKELKRLKDEQKELGRQIMYGKNGS